MQLAFETMNVHHFDCTKDTNSYSSEALPSVHILTSLSAHPRPLYRFKTIVCTGSIPLASQFKISILIFLNLNVNLLRDPMDLFILHIRPCMGSFKCNVTTFILFKT